MTARADFAVKQGTTVPLTFAVLDGKGKPHPSLKHLDGAVLTIVPTAAEAFTLPLSTKPGAAWYNTISTSSSASSSGH